jgi:hypothetical protein
MYFFPCVNLIKDYNKSIYPDHVIMQLLYNPSPDIVFYSTAFMENMWFMRSYKQWNEKNNFFIIWLMSSRQVVSLYKGIHKLIKKMLKQWKNKQNEIINGTEGVC